MKRMKAWSIKNGQLDFDGNVINICDVCGRTIAKPGRHPKCAAKIPRAAKLIRKWALAAMQREVATKKPQSPPKTLVVLARLAGVKIDCEIAQMKQAVEVISGAK